MRRFACLLACLPLLFACSSRKDMVGTDNVDQLDTGTVIPTPDAAPDGVASEVDSDPGFLGDATPVDAEPPLSPGFFVMVAQTPPFSIPMSEWKGVTRFDLTDVGATAVEGKGIDKGLVADPAGLVFRAESAELFVGNRHGNTAADGVAGSVSRFLYHAETRSFTPNGTILGNGLSGVHQITFSPTSGELFAANATGSGGISRFKFDSKGNAVANGTIGSSSMRGVIVAPDGKRLYATTAGNTIEQFDLKTGTALATITVADGSLALHFMAVANNELYAPAIFGGVVYRFTIGSGDELKEKDTIPGDDPIAVAFSPNGLEMFVAGHLSANVIDRYRRPTTTGAWAATKKIDTPVPGTLLVFPVEARPTIPK
jgi:DNA-binding beta-propeller fold protein YncE